MSGGAKLLVLIVVGSVMLMTVSVGLAAASIVHGGTVAVEVHEDDGADVSVHAPAALIDLALMLVPDRSLVMALEQADLHADVDPAAREQLEQLDDWVPAVRDAWQELVEAPDFTAVRVRSGDETVRVEKRGRDLVIVVDADDGDYEVKLPLRTVSKVLRKL